MSEAKAVKFQHRIATGHSTLGKPFEVESDNPLFKTGDHPSTKTVKQTIRHHKPVPTTLVVDDALVLAAPPSADGSAPRVSLIYLNGTRMMGADWQNCVSVEHDVPHRAHKGAEAGERFWFDPSEDRVIAALEAAAAGDEGSASAGGEQASQTGSENQASD